jgi:hypothetical protein
MTYDTAPKLALETPVSNNIKGCRSVWDELSRRARGNYVRRFVYEYGNDD